MSLLHLFVGNLGRRFNEMADRRQNLDLHICDEYIQTWRVR